jgi:hypothetical protein
VRGVRYDFGMTVGNWGSARDTTGRHALEVLMIATLLLTNACGGGHPSVPYAPGGGALDAQVEPSDSGHAMRDSGHSMSDSGPMPVDGGTVDPLAPSVELTSPAPAADPNNDTVVTDANLTVSCKVTRSAQAKSSPVDTSAVKITLERPEDATKLMAPAVTAQPGGVYQATFDLRSFPNGRLRLHCEARDLATPPHIGKATLDTLLDLGPSIDVFDPKNKNVYTRLTPVGIQFQVRPAALSDSDNEANVAQVKLNVSGADTPVMESSTTPGLYQTSIDFNDTAKFPVPPTSAQVVVSISDARTPTAATRVVVVDIAIDGEGPSITVTAPPNLEIVHGVKTLMVTVSDPSGLKPGSLKADINAGALVIDKWDGTAPNFQQKFDTRMFGSELTELTINVSATDTVGNVSTKGHRLRLDNLPPLISLDPPLLREYKASGTDTICSAPFDPVGTLAANDGQRVLTSWHYRALVEDQTNHSPGASVDYLAGVDPGKVQLFVQTDYGVPFLQDTDNDGVCDEIYGLMLPPGMKPWAQLPMGAVTPAGNAWYPAKAPSFDAANPLSIAPGFCKAGAEGDTSPKPICDFSEMIRVVPGEVQGKPPAVYALAPSNDANTGECNGGSWELSFAKPGWLCLAARAEDKIGNVGVSAPLRVCFDDGSHPACAPADMPSCTSNCVISAAQKFPANMVWRQQ